MIAFLKKHSVSIVLTVVAVLLLRSAYLAPPSAMRLTNRWEPVAVNPFLEQTGLWAIRFLLLSLSATPIRLLTGWNAIIRIRKPAGLIAFGFVAVHAFIRLNAIKTAGGLPTPGLIWSAITSPWHIAVGAAAFTVLLAMALTSHTFAMRQLKKNWKRLHRLVYPASILAISHALLNTYFGGKRAGMGGPEARPELLLYMGILIVLLVMRLPFVRSLLRPGGRKRPSRAPDLQTSPSA